MLMLALVALLAQPVCPGKSRWSIKTQPPAQKAATKLTVNQFSKLPVPGSSVQPPLVEDDARFMNKVFDDVPPKNLKEGDSVTIDAWLHVAALDPDEDYHLQINQTPKRISTCIVVEVPNDRCAQDPAVKAAAATLRAMLKKALGRAPSKAGTLFTPPLRVRITGALFFDLAHLRHPEKRGKLKQNALTGWELHPVMDIQQLP